MKNDVTLLTGSTGFLGAQFLSRISHGIYATSRKGNPDKKIHGLDLLDRDVVFESIARIRPTVVIHLGAIVNLSRDAETAKAVLETNIIGTLNLLEAMQDTPPKKIIFASSEEVYGDNPVPFREVYEPRPPSPYAISKVVCEQLIVSYAEKLGMAAVILRFGTMYGPGQVSSRFIPSIINMAIQGEDIPLNSGQKSRDYLYIDDAVEALRLTRELTLSENVTVVNIGGGKAYRLIDLVSYVQSATGSTSRVLAGILPERSSEADTWLMDIEKAQNILGWSPKVPLEEGIKQTSSYFKKSYDTK